MRDEIKKEIAEISAFVAAVGNNNLYKAPTDYFTDLTDEIMSRIFLPQTKTPLAQPAPFYFEGLAASVLQKIKANENVVEENEAAKEISALSPLLASIKKEQVYTVPENYFSSFTVNKATVKAPAKVIALRRPVKWMKYAAAAVIAGIIATGGFLFFDNTNSAMHINKYGFTKNYTAPLSKLSNDAISDYLQSESEDADAMQPLYDDSKENAASLTEELLHNVSDNDIKQYLNENYEPGENKIKGI